MRSISRTGSLILGLAAMLASAAQAAAPSGPLQPALRGFLAGNTAAQLALEQRYDAQLSAADLGPWLQRLSSAANHVGAPHNKENAEWMQAQLRSWGWDAQIEVFDVLYPTLKRHKLEMVAPTVFQAKLHEPPVAGDTTSARTDGMEPYNVFGADGDVTGELVYVNYGMPDDYKELARRGIDVKGRIVIARYGSGWRGLKPKLAQEHGAIGCIIYSDPRDDGYGVGDTYPKGGWRPADAVQRGSVLDMPVYPGDPLTPGVGATKDAKRLALKDAKTVLKIPVLPISYADAEPMLAALGGPVVPPNWRGGLPIAYHFGAGPAKVHLAIESDWTLKPLYNVIARVPGASLPDEWIVRGNHRDAWVFGANDPLSGTIALMAEAKAIGALLKTGWRPQRTLVYASWDGEEPGLLGSTEWAETHAVDLQRHAVLYLNSDGNGRGFLSASGSHALQSMVNEVSRVVVDPQTKVSAQARLRARMQVQGQERGATPDQAEDARKAEAGGDLPIEALGSGSDFTPFLQHLGITTLDIAYGGEGDLFGVYHSAYDSFDHYSRFGDPGFVYGIAEAQTVGRLVLRMANADLLPMQFAGFADTMGEYVDELHKLADGKRKSALALTKLLDQNAFTLATDPTRPQLPPARPAEVPYLDLVPLDNAMLRLKKSAAAYDSAYAKLGPSELTAARREQVNALLRGLEQTLLDPQGLPGRDWYRHLMYAPGLLTGYGVKTMPGVREAIESEKWDEANRYAERTAAALNRYATKVDAATALLQPNN